jgi:glyceraldehyde 3-phosphate dehydrogenase
VQGRFAALVTVEGDIMVAAGHRTKVTCIKNSAELPHKELVLRIRANCTKQSHPQKTGTQTNISTN